MFSSYKGGEHFIIGMGLEEGNVQFQNELLFIFSGRIELGFIVACSLKLQKHVVISRSCFEEDSMESF